ncbi:hypothetical protein KIL84_011901 [Mauremys mutica]|uniref:Uncharacterized protein n=1 Tax=Mauremys mutica TaxID=74926 RepID=A0A9D4B2G9_9SAUR|nr:hypothetical protein KIL84_011901 [Mauremys mutica]
MNPEGQLQIPHLEPIPILCSCQLIKSGEASLPLSRRRLKTCETGTFLLIPVCDILFIHSTPTAVTEKCKELKAGASSPLLCQKYWELWSSLQNFRQFKNQKEFGNSQRPGLYSPQGSELKWNIYQPGAALCRRGGTTRLRGKFPDSLESFKQTSEKV